MNFTKKQRQALDLLARGGARYGTRIEEMKQLKAMGLCYAHDKGRQGWVRNPDKGRWTWRPTEKGWQVIKELSSHSSSAVPTERPGPSIPRALGQSAPTRPAALMDGRGGQSPTIGG